MDDHPAATAAGDAPGASGVDVVRAFLAAFEQRDIERAKSMLAEGFEMTFPGPARFTRIEDVVTWRRKRYRFANKTFDGFEEVRTDEGSVVYCHGTLAGEWPDGSPFSGIRFIDRFTVSGGRLVAQQVWNDLAEELVAMHGLED